MGLTEYAMWCNAKAEIDEPICTYVEWLAMEAMFADGFASAHRKGDGA